MEAKDTILSLAEEACDRFALIHSKMSLREQEAAIKQGSGFYEAAAALLNRFPHLRDELIEHPSLMAARRYIRAFGSF